jgi:hypothetical protein
LQTFDDPHELWFATVAQRHEVGDSGRTGISLKVGLQDQGAFAVAPGHAAHRR